MSFLRSCKTHRSWVSFSLHRNAMPRAVSSAAMAGVFPSTMIAESQSAFGGLVPRAVFFLSFRLSKYQTSPRFYSTLVTRIEVEDHTTDSCEEHGKYGQITDVLKAEGPLVDSHDSRRFAAATGNVLASQNPHRSNAASLEQAETHGRSTESIVGCKVEQKAICETTALNVQIEEPALKTDDSEVGPKIGPVLGMHASGDLTINMAANQIHNVDIVSTVESVRGEGTVPNTLSEIATIALRGESSHCKLDRVDAECSFGSMDVNSDWLHKAFGVQSKTIQDLSSVVSTLATRMDELIASNNMFLRDIEALKSTNERASSLLDILCSSPSVQGQNLKVPRQSDLKLALDQKAEVEAQLPAKGGHLHEGVIKNADPAMKSNEKRGERKPQNVVPSSRKSLLSDAVMKQSIHSPEKTDSLLSNVTGVASIAASPANEKVMKKFKERLESMTLVDEAGSPGAGRPSLAGEHSWPEWEAFLEHVKALNFFTDEEAKKQEGTSMFDESSIKIAVYKYSNANATVFQSLSRKDLKTIAEYGCPTNDRRVVISGKRLRNYFSIEEKTVCDPCTMKDSCEAAYVEPPNVPPKLSDVTRILIKIAEICRDKVTPSRPVPDKVKNCASRLFQKITDLGTKSYEKEDIKSGGSDAGITETRSGSKSQLNSLKVKEIKFMAEGLDDFKSVKQRKEGKKDNAKIEVGQEDARQSKVKESKLSDLVVGERKGSATKNSKWRGNATSEIPEDDEVFVPRSKKAKSRNQYDDVDDDNGSRRQPRSSKADRLFMGDWDNEKPDRRDFKSNRRDHRRSGMWDGDADDDGRSRSRGGYGRDSGDQSRRRGRYGGREGGYSGRGMGSRTYRGKEDLPPRDYGRDDQGSSSRSRFGGRGWTRRGRGQSRF